MAFKLSKAQEARRNELCGQLEDAAGRVEEAVIDFNSRLEAEFALVEEKLEIYNGLVDQATEFADEIASVAGGAIEEKSERWQESDKGRAAEEWKSEWENHGLENAEIEQPTEIEFEADHSSVLEQLPEEMGTV